MAGAQRDERDGWESVTCRHCGHAYRAIAAKHLWRIHGYEDAHPVRAYLARYGLASGLCGELRRRARRRREAWWRARGRRWTRRRIFDEIRRLHRAGASLASPAVPHPLLLAAKRHVGEWVRAVHMAGVAYRTRKGRARIWSRERVIEEIRALAARGEPLWDQHVTRHHGALRAAAHTYIAPGWARALRAAGVVPAVSRKPAGRWTPATAEAWLRRRHAVGRSLRARDVPQDLRSWVYNQPKGGWVAYVHALGLPCAGGKRRDWSPAAVVAEIRARRAAGRSLAFKHVYRESQAILHQARIHFGSWPAALRRAGVDPDAARAVQPWSRARVLAAIRARAGAGQPLDAGAVRGDAIPLHSAACKRWGSWARTLRAAGFDPAQHRAVMRRWDRGAVESWVRARHAAGRPVGAASVPPGAYKRVVEGLGVPWRAFVARVVATGRRPRGGVRFRRGGRAPRGA